MTPRGTESCIQVNLSKHTNRQTARLPRKMKELTGVITSDLNQNILPCFSTKYLQDSRSISQMELKQWRYHDQNHANKAVTFYAMS